MSPSRFHEMNQAAASHRREINGPRPAPLKINKDSHLVQKQTVSASALPSLINNIAAAVSKQVVVLDHQKQRPPSQQRHPVIIYTHSPKIIRTEARDFMALVQKLTGMSRSDEPAPSPPGPSSAVDSTTSSSAVSDVDNQARGFDPPPNSFFSDAPLFTPTGSSDFYCSPQSLIYRCPDPALFNSPSFAFSPSVMEVLQACNRDY